MWQSVQGVTELTVPYRCEDASWISVLNQIRVLQLSDGDYAFLHGTETTVPGSWLNGTPACGNNTCAELQAKWATMVSAGAPWEARQRPPLTPPLMRPVPPQLQVRFAMQHFGSSWADFTEEEMQWLNA